MNRLSWDQCAYSKAVAESVAPVDYMLDPVKFEHCDKCRNELGLVGGTAVSHIAGNLVDLENNLFGIDRPSTKCPNFMYLPRNDLTLQGMEYIKPVCHPKIDTSLHHLKSCQINDYPSIPYPHHTPAFKCSAR
jgi:hypothetical protein